MRSPAQLRPLTSLFLWATIFRTRVRQAFELLCPIMQFVAYASGTISCFCVDRIVSYMALLDTVSVLQESLITWTIAIVIRKRKIPRCVRLHAKRSKLPRDNFASVANFADNAYTVAHYLILLFIMAVTAVAMYIDMAFYGNYEFFTNYSFCLSKSYDYSGVLFGFYRYLDWFLGFSTVAIKWSHATFYARVCHAFDAYLDHVRSQASFILNSKEHLTIMWANFAAVEVYLSDLQTMLNFSSLFCVAVSLRQVYTRIEYPNLDVGYFGAIFSSNLLLILAIAHANSLVSKKFIAIRTRMIRQDEVSRSVFKLTVGKSLAFRDWTGESLTRKRAMIALQAIFTISLLIYDMTREKDD